MTIETSRIKLSRRQLLAGTSAAAAGSLVAAGTASAKAPLQGTQPVNYRRVKLGAFEVTTVADGYAAVPKVHPIFGNNQKPEDVSAYMQANFLPGDKMAIPFTPVIVNTGKELVLFDAGNGSGRGPTRGHLVKSIEAAGFKPEQIDIVVITHFHPDHIGGIMAGDKPTFPNARYVTGEDEYNFWTSKKLAGSSDKKMQGRVKLVNAQVKPVADKMTFLKDGNDVVSGITAIPTFGHTPGHMAFNIESNGQRLVLWGD
ncbi:MAG: MBL fold metallo-hydrolase, partial [Hyphomicrobiaceae bacterium]